MGITVDGELAYPTVPHLRCVEAGTCQGYCLEGVIDEHGLLYGPGDILGLPIHYGEAVKFDGMTCGVGMAIDGGGALRHSLYLSPKFLPIPPIVPPYFDAKLESTTFPLDPKKHW